MHHPIGRFYSDSDDDRPSSSESLTSVSQCAQEHQLPSSLRKLLNPVLPSPPLSPARPQSTDPAQAPLARICLAKQKDQDIGDLTRLRPWKRLPLPHPMNPQLPVPLPPIYLCLPAPRTAERSSGASSTIGPHFNPYYLPPPRVSRERMVCASHRQTPSRVRENFDPNIDEPNRVPDAAGWTRKAMPALPSPGNRCLTCGSSFSTFANLTRHEKKCPVDSKQVAFYFRGKSYVARGDIGCIFFQNILQQGHNGSLITWIYMVHFETDCEKAKLVL
ncbi:hypothetical protein VP01_1317g3 [Puccinia sorghi]|uniref:C2H2-type domain-containing protein n=1 Tax=Puccinia sorghi TaxID=27349 RepID=A0A0L6VNB5_9BASI|nr:hypothetical protein VP01_1317g3 [Puccinia sorghi]